MGEVSGDVPNDNSNGGFGLPASLRPSRGLERSSQRSPGPFFSAWRAFGQVRRAPADRLGRSWGFRDVPGVVFVGRNASFFVPRCHCNVAVAQNARSAFCTVKTNTESTSAWLRVVRKTLENRSAGVLASVRLHDCVTRRLRSVPGASRERSRSVPGRSWGALGSPGASSERLAGVPGASRGAPSAPPIAQERSRIDFRAFRVRFWSVRRASGSLPERLSHHVFHQCWCACSRYNRSVKGQQNVMSSELFRVHSCLIA